jgi:hypothetical protein
MSNCRLNLKENCLFNCHRSIIIAILTIAFLTTFCSISLAGKGIPRDRLDITNILPELAYANKLWQENKPEEAIKEIEKQIGLDSSLVTQAAIILGGNYHLVRLTNNVFADRVGSFSPSGEKLVYARDTSLIRYDDGLFDRYEDRATGIVYYDFSLKQEIIPDIPLGNAFKPKFYTDSCFLYLTGSDKDTNGISTNLLNIYDILTGTSKECFPLKGQHYCLCDKCVIYYDNDDGAFILKSLTDGKQRTLFDNDNIFSLRRSLPLVQNLSCSNDIVLFQAGHNAGRVIPDIYGLPSAGGKPKKMTNRNADWYSDPIFYPAAVSDSEFAYLEDANGDVDIYYQAMGKNYRLTYDGGDKFYLAISPDGLKVAYSYMPSKQGVENYEIFILNFASNATIDDIKYRFSQY